MNNNYTNKQIFQELNDLLEVGISVKTIQEVNQHMMTKLILFLDKNIFNFIIFLVYDEESDMT